MDRIDALGFWVADFIVGMGVGFSISPPANAEPIYCDPLTPLYDYKTCYVMNNLERHEPIYQFRPQAPPPDHFGGHGSY
jgi:hypothetical protein